MNEWGTDGPVRPFRKWHQGWPDRVTTRIMDAAAGHDPLLDDAVHRLLADTRNPRTVASPDQTTRSVPDTASANFRRIHYLSVLFPLVAFVAWVACSTTVAWVFVEDPYPIWLTVTVLGILPAGLLVVLLTAPLLRTAGVPRSIHGGRLHVRTLFGRRIEVDLDQVTSVAYSPGYTRFRGRAGIAGPLIGGRIILVHPAGYLYRRRVLRRLLLPVHAPHDLFPEQTLATVVVLNRWWEHEVLRPVVNRLVTGPAALAPQISQLLRLVRQPDLVWPAKR